MATISWETVPDRTQIEVFSLTTALLTTVSQPFGLIVFSDHLKTLLTRKNLHSEEQFQNECKALYDLHNDLDTLKDMTIQNSIELRDGVSANQWTPLLYGVIVKAILVFEKLESESLQHLRDNSFLSVKAAIKFFGTCIETTLEELAGRSIIAQLAIKQGDQLIQM